MTGRAKERGPEPTRRLPRSKSLQIGMSDGTRTRDLRRDRPAAASFTITRYSRGYGQNCGSPRLEEASGPVAPCPVLYEPTVRPQVRTPNPTPDVRTWRRVPWTPRLGVHLSQRGVCNVNETSDG